ncbi:MAG TPA: FkbM family methyltransferase [Pedobacter sp.]|jgi:FkbM family methyltransferase
MLTRIIYPLELREKVSWRVMKLYHDIPEKDIPLEFNRNIKLDLSKNDIGHQSIIFNGFYELGLTKTIIRLGKIGGLLVDVGANYGYFSCLWASQNSINKVLAFEASPANIQPLINNVNKNGLSKAITIISNAVGKEYGKLNFDLADGTQQTGWGGFSFENNSTTIEVEADTLDNYAVKHNVSKIDVLKIDTEGADTWVLYGAERLLKEKKIDNIFFEHNSTKMIDLNIGESESQTFLENLDYIVEQHSPTDFYAFPKSRRH